MTSLFRGAHQAQHYAACRPTYPKAVYELIVSKAKGTSSSITNPHQKGRGDGSSSSNMNTATSTGTPPTHFRPSCCYDVGCGTGQATAALVDYFDQVIGVDPSPTQIQEAIQHARITYRIGSVEEHLSDRTATAIPDHSVQCIASAQAVHWFDIPIFYQHVHRILQPNGGVLALWTYGLPTFPEHPQWEAIVRHIYDDILGDEYWDPRRKLVENLYRDIPLIDEFYPGAYTSERISPQPKYNIHQNDLTLTQLQGYIRSWSAYTKYCERHNIEPGSEQDPAETLFRPIKKDKQPLLVLPLQEDEEKTADCIWPVAMLISVKK